MKKGILFVALAAIVLGFASCSRQTAFQLNQKLVSISDSVTKKFEVWGVKLGELTKTKNYAELKPYREDIETFVTTKIEEVKKMKDVGGSEKFRQGLIKLLEFQKSACSIMVEFEKCDKSTPDQQVADLFTKFTKEASKENKLLSEVQSTQREFARKNNFRLAR